MEVSGIGATGTGAAAGVGASTWSGASRRLGGDGAVGRMQAAVGGVSGLLGMSTSDVVKQLGSGASLASIAAGQGVSRDTLLATVRSSVAGAAPQGGTPLSGDLLSTVAARIADATSVSGGLTVPGGS